MRKQFLTTILLLILFITGCQQNNLLSKQQSEPEIGEPATAESYAKYEIKLQDEFEPVLTQVKEIYQQWLNDEISRDELKTRMGKPMQEYNRIKKKEKWYSKDYPMDQLKKEEIYKEGLAYAQKARFQVGVFITIATETQLLKDDKTGSKRILDDDLKTRYNELINKSYLERLEKFRAAVQKINK